VLKIVKLVRRIWELIVCVAIIIDKLDDIRIQLGKIFGPDDPDDPEVPEP